MWRMPETIPELLARNVADFPAREAFVSVLHRTGEWVRHTWRELDEITDRLAAGLARVGVGRAQKVAFMHTNSAECYYAYLAVHKLGALFVPINVRLVAREVAFILEHCEAEFLIIGSDLTPLLDQMPAARTRMQAIVCIEKQGDPRPDGTLSFAQLTESPVAPPAAALSPDDEADLLYTTGTTGLPKGVILTQANKLACGRMLGATWGLQRKHYSCARAQNAFPFFTSTGVSSVMMPWLYYGYTQILEPAFDVVPTLETIQREKTTAYAAAPSMFIFILDHPRLQEYDTSSLDAVAYGGSAMPEEVIKRLLDTWPGLKVYNAYGLTEGGTGGTCLNALDAVSKLGSIGLPWVPDQEVRVVDEQDQNVGVREIGEIVLRGPNVMKGYYKNPESTAEALRNGWLHTGDMGYYDEDGYLYYSDRKKDMVIRGGFNIYPVEVEGVLYEHPAVKQCAVIGKPHAKLGEDVLALVVPNEEARATAEELIEFCADKLADFKRPREVRFVASLPINPMGKVDKKMIRATFLATGEESG